MKTIRECWLFVTLMVIELVLVLFLSGSFVAAQDVVLYTPPPPYDAPSERAKVMLVYTAVEDSQSLFGTVYAVNCYAGSSGCGRSSTKVIHHKFFDTKQQAIDFFNHGCVDVGHGTAWGSGAMVTAPYNPQLIGLYSVSEIPVTEKETTTTTPQPPIVTTKKTYEVK